MDPGQDAPVDDQRLSGRPDPGPPTTRTPLAPRRFRVRDQPAQVPSRTRIARRAGLGHQPLSRDPARAVPYPLRDQVSDPVVVPDPRRLLDPSIPRLVGLDDSLHGLVGRPADRGRPSVTAHVSVGGKHVHPFPRVLQWRPLRGDVAGWHRHRHHAGLTGSHDTANEEWGLQLAKTGDSDLATSGDFFMATDTREPPPPVCITECDECLTTASRFGASPVRWRANTRWEVRAVLDC